MNKQEFKRLEDAFKQEVLKRSSPLNGSSAISKYSFIKEVLGDYVPPPIAEVSCISITTYFISSLFVSYIRLLNV